VSVSAASHDSRLGFAVAQLGARRHYAVPRILYGAGLLERLYTDICAVKGWPRLLDAIPGGLRPAGLRRLMGRVPDGVPAERITSFTRFGIEYAWRRARARRPGEITATHLWAGRRFCQLILRQAFRGASGIYCFNSAGLELLRAARERGALAVMEQTIASVETQEGVLRKERERFPAWETFREDPFRVELAEREKREWENSDLIVCGSEFVRQSIAEAHGPVERCVVVPYGVDSKFTLDRKVRPNSILHVLFVGSIGLRKGAPYVLEAVRRLGRAVHVRMVGPITVSAKAQAELRQHVELTGAVPRSEILGHYRWADVFLLPSLCEGSATVCYEALAAGLPVITTPNAGSVVRDGVDGFIVPIRDPEAIAEKLDLLARDRHLLAWMSRSARERAKEFTLEKYSERLVEALLGTQRARRGSRADMAPAKP